MQKHKVPHMLTVPDTVEGIAGLLTAREWDKAAIVYAWTRVDAPGGRPPKDEDGGDNRRRTDTVFGIREFAALGLTGLSSTTTVTQYRKAWTWAIENGLADPVGPGDELDTALLFEQAFPPSYGREAVATEIETGPAYRAPAAPAKRAIAAKDGAKAGAKSGELPRREQLGKIEQLSVEVVVEATDWAQKYGRIVEDEVEQVLRIGEYLIEAQRLVGTFAVDPQPQPRRSTRRKQVA